MSADVVRDAQAIVDRLKVAEAECDARYVDSHREAASLPVVLGLAEVVAALAVMVAGEQS